MTRSYLSVEMLMAALLGGAALVACGGAEVEDEVESTEPTEEASSPLVGGTFTNVRPEIGTLGFCTATLVDPRYIVTASHCLGYTTGPRNDTFTIRSTTGAHLGSFTVDQSYALGASLGAADVAFARLTTAVPRTMATPATFARAPSAHERVSVFGYGCTSRPGGGGGFKQFVDYSFGDTTVNCPGDSGGPRVLDFHTGTGGIWGLNSGYWTGSGIDLNANASAYGPMVLNAVRAFGGTTVTNSLVANFPTWATVAGARAVAGDFDGDGHGDVALAGGAGWNTVPVAFGDGAGGFWVTNSGVANFPSWATAARSLVAADFNGDGATDLALLGGPGWNTIPVAFSNRDGSFTVTNLQTPNIPGWAQVPGAYAVAGDFNADGAGDIALVGGQGWNTVPVAFSNRNGTFAQTNAGVVAFPGWAQTPGARAMVGDFDGDGDADLALTGASGWNTIPLAFSDRLGGFAVSNRGVADFPGWATSAGVKLAAGDFDGDGDADIAAVGGAGWRTTAFALSDRAGGFTSANLPMANFPGWGNAARFALAVKADFNGTTDLVLTGGAGWQTIPVAFLRP